MIPVQEIRHRIEVAGQIALSERGAQYCRQITPEQASEFQSKVIGVVGDMLDAYVNKGISERAIAQKCLRSIDYINDRLVGREQPISCKKGCSYCCYINVDCSVAEMSLIAKRHRKAVTIAKKKPRLKAQLEAEDGLDGWRKLKREERACVFLEEKTGECSVYEHRPAVCRLQNSILEPEKCADIGGGVMRSVAWEAEIIYCAVMNVWGISQTERLVKQVANI